MTPASQIAHYRITTKLGEGGMGAVYRATDTKLNREVAIKILPKEFSGDPDRFARFTREAQVLASLNHPNIAAIYGVEEHSLILELIEGPTLAERIAQGPISLAEALPLVQQFVEALEYAHERGVVHRDLKPANLKITPEGRLKVLDFGLAKALAAEAAAPDPKYSATVTMHATMAGAILGTAAYMAPEQARGHTVDKRADIWAFGAILYEMLTGRALFDGPTVSDTLALVLTKEVDFASAPPEVRVLLRRCLERDARKRLRDIGDSLPLIDSAPPATAAAPGKSRTAFVLGALAVAGLLAAGALAFLHLRERPPDAELFRFEIPTPPTAVMGQTLSLSPNGRQLAFTARKLGGVRQIWIRRLDALESRALPGTESTGNSLIWSPDSRFLMYAALGQVRKVDVSSGASQVVCSGCPAIQGGAWNAGGLVLFTTSFSGLVKVPVSGESAVPVQGGAAIRGSIAFLRDGRRFLYSSQNGIYVGAADAPFRDDARPILSTGDLRFAYAQTSGEHDHILFERSGALLAQAIDKDKLALVGTPVTVASEVTAFTASNTGVLAYRSGSISGAGNRLIWYDRTGTPGPQLGPSAAHSGVAAFSADGKSVLVDRAEPDGTYRGWIGDVARGVFSRIGTEAINEAAPIPLPDGRIVVSHTMKGGQSDLYVLGAGQPEAWVQSPNVKHANDVSPDGRYLIYDDHNGAPRQDLWVLRIPPPGTAPEKPIPFLATAADETFGQFSPDGRWVAYSSDETGQREIYVREFLPTANPAAGAKKWLVSVGGGDKPRWAKNGKELFYLSPGSKMMAVPVKTAPQFEPGIPVALFDVIASGFSPYDVSADGRFLINTPPPPGGESNLPIVVVLNWTAGLK
jgi:serine/threonine protein kinase/Tol biopolymer transport system component